MKACNQQTWQVHFREKSRIKWTVLPDLQAKVVLPHLKRKIMNMYQKQLESQIAAYVRAKRKGKWILLSQSTSSDLSWQSISPLHLRCASIHCPFSHWNWDAEHIGQLSSSLWSSHSGNPSHRHAIGIQSISPVAQVNWSGEQVGGSGERENRTRVHSFNFSPFNGVKIWWKYSADGEKDAYVWIEVLL